MHKKRKISRREFLQLSAMMSGGLVLASCAPEATKTEAPTEAAEATLAPTEAAEATLAPTEAAEATLTPALPTATEAPAEGMWQTGLIGELQGPELVLDAANFPTSFSEAPMLAELVASGALPPVAERLPEQESLMVWQPLNEVGVYGGTWHRGFTGAGDTGSPIRTGMALDRMFMTKWDRSGWIPNLCKDLEILEDGKVFKVHLRKGLKWSDGMPLTSADFAFWWDEIYKNEDFNMSTSVNLVINGQECTFEVIDDYTISYTFPEKNYLFADRLSGWFDINSHVTWGNYGGRGGGFVPAHYMKQFHPSYVDLGELNDAATEEGFEDWLAYFANQINPIVNPECPCATPWIITRPINEDVCVMERNPYYYGVDTDGNQLPYIDQVVFELVPDSEQLNLNAIAGKYDFQARHLQVPNIPVFIENQEKGNYKLYIDPASYGAEAGLSFNMSYGLMPDGVAEDDTTEYYEDFDIEIAELIHNKDFRHAISMGIERDQINEAYFLGLGVVGSGIPDKANPFYPGDEWKTKWHTLDIEAANKILDDMGYTEKDDEGVRIRKDGTGSLKLEVIGVTGRFFEPGALIEMLADQLKTNIGVMVEPKIIDQNLVTELNNTNAVQLQIHDNSNSEDIFGGSFNLYPNTRGSWMAPLWGYWFENAEWGVRPDEPMVDFMDTWRRGPSMPFEERVKEGQRMWTIYVDECWLVGMVGQTASVMGVRVAKNNVGNVPGRQLVGTDTITPGASAPQTFYFKE